MLEEPAVEARAQQVIKLVSIEARAITGANWYEPEDAPEEIYPTLLQAAFRLYTNPARFQREAEGDYSYYLDSSVTGAEIFTDPEKARLKKFAGLQIEQDREWAFVNSYRGDLPAFGSGSYGWGW